MAPLLRFVLPHDEEQPVDDRVVLFRVAVAPRAVRDLVRGILVVPLQPPLAAVVRRFRAVAVVRLLVEGGRLLQRGRPVLVPFVPAAPLLAADALGLDAPPPQFKEEVAPFAAAVVPAQVDLALVTALFAAVLPLLQKAGPLQTPTTPPDTTVPRGEERTINNQNTTQRSFVMQL